jgi:hypothetical protein
VYGKLIIVKPMSLASAASAPTRDTRTFDLPPSQPMTREPVSSLPSSNFTMTPDAVADMELNLLSFYVSY